MFRMEVDASVESIPPSNYDLILQRLSLLGVPDENLNHGQHGLVAYAKDNGFRVPQLVSAILPSDELEEGEDVFRESLSWLQWLMFEGEPDVALEHLAKMSENERGVCGAVWGNNDIAFRCRTCEHDPTCAICVPCFENGNHKDHDYSVIYTGGGCCDCGDVTAWKREGFCSKHRGAEQIQPLPENVAKSLGPVMDLLLGYWKNKLQCGKRINEESPRASDHAAELQKIADELTTVAVEMLLNFCKHSESLLSFISGRVYSSVGLLDALLRAESFMHDSVVGKLHELLLKLLGEPVFKYEFAKVFVRYYPMIVDEAIKESTDTVFKKYPLLSTFSVQILTVPTLTPRLVEEMNLMDMLLQCLENIFVACARDDGRLQVAKWAPLYETSLRVVEDIRFVMSHAVVPKYLCNSRRDLVKMWMRLLASVQGMNAQKREMGNHIEEENENVHLPFVLCHSISNILSLLVTGAFSVSSNLDTREEASFGAYELEREDQDSPRLAKVGRLSQESYVSSVTGKCSSDYGSKAVDRFPLPSSALWLLHECLRSMENWLGLDNTVGTLSAASLKTNNCSGNNFFALKRTLSKFRRGRYMFKSSSISYSKLSTSSEAHDRQSNLGIGSECGASTGQEAGFDDHMLDGESTSELERLRVLSLSDWPDITFDVSSQEISINIPIHRLLSMVLRTALKICYGESISSSFLNAGSADQSVARSSDFLGQILEGCHPYGFSAFVMEHPLRIRVFCAEVHAGMWRRNGDAPILFSEWYRSVRWSEQGQELDLFLLQCCAALSPADFFIKRILGRFGLADYLSLKLEQSSEYEPILVTEMLALLIQIVKERRFCGLTTAECLQKELVYKLSIGDATRSQLVKSLPRDLSKTDKIQEVLDTVAEYSHPSGMTQGMYRLLTPYWKELDLYHPRWNSRDLQAAEERYSRFCNVSALTNQLPRWTKIYYPLRNLAKIATCRTLAEIVRAVLFYSVHTEKFMTSRAPDGVLLTGLHLLALALDVCRVHKESGDPLCCEGDVIPFLAFVSEEISTSDYGDQSMLSLLVSLMRMREKENAENFTEAGKFSLSSLVSSLLDKFAELEPGCMTKLQKLAPESANHFRNSVLNSSFKETESTSESSKLKAKSRERQAAILERMRDQQSKFLESFNSNADDEMDDVKSEGEVCDSETSNQIQDSVRVSCSLCHDPKSRSPVSFLVLLQKSRLLSFVDKGPPSWEQVLQSGKGHVSSSPATYNGILPVNVSDGSDMISSSQLIDVVQSALNDLASLGRPAEVDSFLQFVKARFPSLKNVQLPCMSTDKVEGTASSLEAFEERMYLLIKRSPSGLNNSDSPNKDGTFLATESDTERSCGAESLLLGKYIAALSKEPTDCPSASQNAHSRSDQMQSEANKWHLEHDKFGPAGSDGIYVSSCGHAVHQGCLDRYLSSLRERYIRRIVFEGGHIVDPDQGEFLCPVCRGLSNAVLPVLPGDLRKIPQPSVVSTRNFMDVGFPPTSSDMVGSLRLQNALSLVQTAANVAGSNESLTAFPARNVSIISNLEPILRLLCGVYYPGQDKILETGRVSNSLILWDTLRYSLISTEIAARSRKSSLSSDYSLGTLYRELNSSSGFILSLLMHATQSIRTSNSLTVLLRLRGIQLCAKSLCCGASPNEYSSHFCQRGGSMLYILDNAEAEVQYPDTQLWRRLSEPVLACDAFSSLMWTLFCLPWPILSCKESFMSLVHAFYTVSVTQAILTYYRKKQGIICGLGCHDCLITDIYKAVGEYGEVVQCFDSYYVDATYDIYDSIRSLTFPYLRRCVLLWKLINCSNSIPFNNGIHTWGGSQYTEGADNPAEELPEVEKLEKMFGIPPFGVVIADKELRVTASRWMRHFSEALRFHKSQCLVRCTPSVPFKLMLLPHLYQDLLQRYIKKRCPDCGALKEEPALCLLCGKLCSPSWKTCCRGTGCQTHASACGAGIGVFLLIRRTTILLQRSARQAPWPSPYLDAFGEEDVEMHRGKPLFLNEERYAALTHMVASHGLDRSSKVLRKTTTGSFFVF
ncbi:E3 ubiquitin-protein ligase PRT6-like isoform X1 [Primulina eburnea]|uniref:E3 ubiquitin-protein ligase PRT6-like isoform X1 n=1 Tax=Primulina eburnea TaxID=1245227 RepID=UPI003C6BE708